MKHKFDARSWEVAESGGEIIVRQKRNRADSKFFAEDNLLQAVSGTFRTDSEVREEQLQQQAIARRYQNAWKRKCRRTSLN